MATLFGVISLIVGFALGWVVQTYPITEGPITVVKVVTLLSFLLPLILGGLSWGVMRILEDTELEEDDDAIDSPDVVYDINRVYNFDNSTGSGSGPPMDVGQDPSEKNQGQKQEQEIDTEADGNE